MIPTWNAEDAAMAQPPLEGVVEDVDDIPVPAEGTDVLYRAGDDRIIDLEEVDPDESGE